MDASDDEKEKGAAAASTTEPAADKEGVKRMATLSECLFLLRASVDEKRLVGLLLVTKFLQAGDDATLQARKI